MGCGAAAPQTFPNLNQLTLKKMLYKMIIMSLSFLQPHGIVIFSISVFIFIISLFLKIFRWNGFFVFIFSFIIFIISLFFKNLFLQFLSVSVLFIFDFLIIYYIAIFINYRKKSIDYFSLSDGMIHPFEDACIKIEAKNLPIPFPGIYFLLTTFDWERTSLFWLDIITHLVVNMM